jgi:muramidase (phage lysozyme)
MATGTGLPAPQSGGPVLAQAAGGVSADALFNAQSWTQIAGAGEQLAKAGGDYLKVAEHKAQVGYLSDQDVEIQRKQIEYRNTHANDPAGFDAAWNGYAEGKLSTAEPWAINHIRAKLGASGNGAYSAILNETRVQTERKAELSWSTLHDMAAQDVQSAAMAGTLNTPEGQLKVEKYRGVVATGVTSQFIVPEVAEQRVATLESVATVYAARAGIKSTFDADGPIAAVKQIDEIARDEKLRLSPEQRLSLGAKLRADVHAWDAERTQNLSTVDLESKSLLQAKQGGIPIPQTRIDEVVSRYKRFGGQAQAASFLADVQHSEDMSFLSRAPLAQSAAWIEEYKTSRGFSTAVNTAIPAEGRALLDRIAGPESGGRYDVRYGGQRFQNFADHPRVAEPITSGPDVGKTSSAAGRYQFIGSTWDDQAKKLGLTNFSPANQDAAAWNLAQEEYKSKTGKDLLTVLRSDDKAAIAEVPRTLSGQWSSLPGGRQPAAVAVPATPSDVAHIGKANQLVAKRVSDEADGIIKGMADKDNPVLPTEQRINDLLTAASATNMPEVLQRVSQAAAEYQFRRQFGRAPEPQETAYVTDLQRRAATEGLSATDARRLEIATETRDRTAKALADDPLDHTVAALAETAGMPPPAPLNIGNPVAFRGGLAARAQWAETGTRTFETGPMPALTTAEATQVRAALDAADPAGKARIYGDIVATTSGGTRAATLAKIAGNGGANGMVEAFAGGMFGMDPAVGESIIRGQGALKLKDAYNPMKDGNKENSSAAIDKYFPAGAFTLAARTDPQGAYAVMRGAIVARVADIAATDPNFDGKFTDAMFERAANDVTGGVVRHNGGSLISPARGMTQRGFDAKMAGLTDGDVQGVMTQSGTPITADYVRNNAQLESLSDGRYLVRLGRDPERPIYAFRDVGANVPNRLRPFILDLRNVTPATPAIDPTHAGPLP